MSETEVDPCSALTADQQALVREVLARTVDKWGLWVMTELSEDGPLRFSQLQKRVARISQKSLTATLRDLERDGLVTRTMVAQVPSRVDFAPTPLGRALVEQVHPLWLWAIERLPEVTAARAAYDAKSASDA